MRSVSSHEVRDNLAIDIQKAMSVGKLVLWNKTGKVREPKSESSFLSLTEDYGIISGGCGLAVSLLSSQQQPYSLP